MLQQSNGKILIAQLSVIAKAGHYAHCYFFGRIQPDPVATARLIAVVESLDYPAFTVRRTVAALNDGISNLLYVRLGLTKNVPIRILGNCL